VKFANTCIHTLSRLADRYTKSLTCRNKWTLRTTTFYLNLCHSTRTPQETSICWQWLQNSLSSSWVEDMRVRSELMTLVLAAVTQSSNVNMMGSILRIIPQSSAQSSFWRRNWGWRRSIPWQFRLAAQSSASPSSMYNRSVTSSRVMFQRYLTRRARPLRDLCHQRVSQMLTPPTWIDTIRISRFTCSRLNTKQTLTSRWRTQKVTMMLRTPSHTTLTTRLERWTTE